MTADGELYIDEDCRDTFEKELNDWFGKDMWELYGSAFSGCWDMAEFPKYVEVDVKDIETDETIGKVRIETEFEVEEGMEKRYIEAYPKAIKLIDGGDKLKQIVKEKINKIKKEVRIEI